MHGLHLLALVVVGCNAWAPALGGVASRPSLASRPARMPLLDDPTKTQEESAEEQERARRFIDFLEASPEPFHVVAKVKKLLEAQGYTVSEK